MTQEELSQLAKDIIKNNIYLTLGTVNESWPWTSPVYYGVNDKYTFYFVSQIKTVHAQNILKNPQVSYAIFDSNQKGRKILGVQGTGKAYVLEENDVYEALQWYKTSYIDNKVAAFIGSSPYRFFKIEPEHFYILDPFADIDRRIETFLNK